VGDLSVLDDSEDELSENRCPVRVPLPWRFDVDFTVRPGNALAAISANRPVSAMLHAIAQRFTRRRRRRAASRACVWGDI
jgi:hypothetical protein